MSTRSAEALSAIIAIAVSISMFTSPDSTLIVDLMNQAKVLPEWAYISICCALFSLGACFFNSEKIKRASRFISGCLWGTVVMICVNFQQWLPLFWIATAMFGFDIYLVAVKGRAWSRSNF